MKKFLVLVSALFIATSFTACFGGDDNSSSQPPVTPSPSPSMTPSPSPSISPSPDVDIDMGGLDSYGMAIKEVYQDDYMPDTMMSEMEIEEKIGLTSDMYDEIIAEHSTLEYPDTFIAVKTDMPTEVKEKLEAYKEALLSDSSYEKFKDKIEASEVYENGDYVFFILLGANEFDGEDMDIATNYKNEVKKGTDALENMFE